MPKNNSVERARSQRNELQGQLCQMESYMSSVSPELRDQAQEYMSRMSSGIERATSVEVNGTNVGDLISTGTSIASDVAGGSSVQEAVLENTVGTAIDNFLEEYANWEGDLVEVPSFNRSIPVSGPLGVNVRFSASLEAALVTTRSGASITATATIDGTARVGIGLSIGFDVPLLGNMSVSGGVKGGPDLSGRASMSLEASGTNLSCSMDPATLNIDMGAELYLTLPDISIGALGVEIGTEDVVEWVADHVSFLGSDGCDIEYDLGSIEILVATTPGYSFTFNMSNGRFTGGRASGTWSFDLNDDIKDAVYTIKRKVLEAVDAINPF